MKQISVEKFIEKIDANVYPITIIKFLLNKRKILSYFNKASSKSFELRGNKYLIDNSNCELCNLKEKDDENIYCRQHTSIYRVLQSGKKVAYDVATETYFYKNEIFKQVGDNRIVIIYCPHTKLISEIGKEINDSNVRKINPITFEDPKFNYSLETGFESVSNFNSNELLGQNMKCWFDNTFSIVTIPEDNNYSNWCLVPNK